MSDFVTSFKPLYESLVAGYVPVARAVEMAIDFEEEQGLAVPEVYVSTAITSGGYARDESLSIPEVIAANNSVGQRIVGSLHENHAPQLSRENVMLPTELGAVPEWGDTHYILFYFCWLSGLSVSGTAWVEQQLAEPAYKKTIDTANKRKRDDGQRVPNEERWPSYRIFVEATLTNLAIAESRPGGKRTDGSEFLFQLVDADYSLGCKAEQMYADVRRLDRLAPSFASDLPAPLGTQIEELRTMKARVGVERKPSELVPVHLR